MCGRSADASLARRSAVSTRRRRRSISSVAAASNAFVCVLKIVERGQPFPRSLDHARELARLRRGRWPRRQRGKPGSVPSACCSAACSARRRPRAAVVLLLQRWRSPRRSPRRRAPWRQPRWSAPAAPRQARLRPATRATPGAARARAGCCSRSRIQRRVQGLLPLVRQPVTGISQQLPAPARPGISSLHEWLPPGFEHGRHGGREARASRC